MKHLGNNVLKKILYIIRNLSPGGAETFLCSLLKVLNRQKYKPEVLCIYGGGVLQQELDKINIPTHIMNFSSLYDIKSHLTLYKFLRNRKFDIIHTKLFHADLVGRLYGVLTGTPAIISTIENIHEWDKSPSIKQLIKESVCRISSKVNYKVIAVSSLIQDVLIERVGIDSQKVKVIYNGVNVDQFNPDTVISTFKSEFNIPENHFIVGAVGTINVNKNHKCLIDAAYEVLLKRKDVHFVIVGRGDSKKLKKYADELNILSKIHFIGLRRDLANILKSIDIYVLTSLSEGISISLLEAMAMRKAVVATNVGGNPEVINNNENGILVTPNQQKELASNILSLISDPEKIHNFGDNARQRVEKEFNLEKTAREYEILYGSVNVK